MAITLKSHGTPPLFGAVTTLSTPSVAFVASLDVSFGSVFVDQRNENGQKIGRVDYDVDATFNMSGELIGATGNVSTAENLVLGLGVSNSTIALPFMAAAEDLSTLSGKVAMPAADSVMGAAAGWQAYLNNGSNSTTRDGARTLSLDGVFLPF